MSTHSQMAVSSSSGDQNPPRCTGALHRERSQSVSGYSGPFTVRSPFPRDFGCGIGSPRSIAYASVSRTSATNRSRLSGHRPQCGPRLAAKLSCVSPKIWSKLHNPYAVAPLPLAERRTNRTATNVLWTHQPADQVHDMLGRPRHPDPHVQGACIGLPSPRRGPAA